MNARIHCSATPEVALVTITAPRRPILAGGLLLMLLLLAGFALLWSLFAGALILSFDPQAMGLGAMIAVVPLGMTWLLWHTARFNLGWELFGREEIRVTDESIAVVRAIPRVPPTKVGARKLEAVKRVFVASRLQWETQGGRAVCHPKTWIVVVAENAKDLQFGLSLGEADAEELASLICSEIEARRAKAPLIG